MKLHRIFIGMQYSISKILLAILLCCCYSQLATSQGTSKDIVIVHILTIMMFSSVIIQSPQNQSVCEAGTVNFTCVLMFTSRTPGHATWFTDDGSINALTLPDHSQTDDSNGRPAPANVTTVLTVTNVNISNNGSDYICVQNINERSHVVFLTVFGELE